MFDTVLVDCPNCGDTSEFQSKGGDCFLRCYTLDSCPEDVLSDINRHAPNHCDCGISYEVDINNKQAVLTTNPKTK